MPTLSNTNLEAVNPQGSARQFCFETRFSCDIHTAQVLDEQRIMVGTILSRDLVWRPQRASTILALALVRQRLNSFWSLVTRGFAPMDTKYVYASWGRCTLLKYTTVPRLQLPPVRHGHQRIRECHIL